MANHINAWVALDAVKDTIQKTMPYMSKSQRLKLKAALAHIRKVEMILENFVN